MAKTRQEKAQTLTELTSLFGSAKSVVFTNFAKINVSDTEELRRECRNEGVSYMVAKKTLMRLAARNAGIDFDPSSFEGEVAAVFGLRDEVAPAKLLAKFKKAHETMKFVGGLLEGKSISVQMVDSLAKLPSKDELIAKFVGSVRAPLSGLVNVLQGNLRALVQVLKKVQETKTT